ncbi:hypothetical protein [Caballeronia sp. Lep1P3]|uniref:hypothetical protein n=1 Tax=Caballeronia sp. Lep1P3 TaxID=2878150 RepID=UPI00351D3C62
MRLLTERLVTRTTGEWVRAFDEAGLPAGPVLDVAQARGMVVESHHPLAGDVKGIPADPLLGPRRAAARTAHARSAERDRLCGRADRPDARKRHRLRTRRLSLIQSRLTRTRTIACFSN